MLSLTSMLERQLQPQKPTWRATSIGANQVDQQDQQDQQDSAPSAGALILGLGEFVTSQTWLESGWLHEVTEGETSRWGIDRQRK